jgi:acyl-CoA synthetase (NDP forming)
MTSPDAAKVETAQIAKLFTARAVAVVGATPDLTKLGSSPIVAMQNLGYRGEIFAVNPRYADVMGHRSVGSIAELPPHVETAMIMLPAEGAVAAVEECARKGIRAIVLISQGFGEAGGEGERRDQRVVGLAREFGLAICGPNTNGLANPRSGLGLAIAPIYQYPGRVRPGSVAVVSQSGGMVSTILAKLERRGVGISKTVTCGNELLLNAADYLACMAEDPETKTIVLFLETIRDLPALRRSLAKCRAAGKPVVALKVGQSDSGQKAALSHTGAIAGSYRNTVAFLEREGAVVADDIDTLAVMTELVTRYKWPTAAPPKTCIVSISGGFAALAADEMARLGLTLPDPSPEAVAELRALENQSHPVNPYDIASRNALILPAIDIFKRDGFNQLIFGLALLKSDIRRPVRQMVVDAKQAGFEQVYVASPELDEEETAFFHAQGISVSDETRPLFEAMRRLAEWRGPTVAPPLPSGRVSASVLPAGSGLVNEADSKAALSRLGIRVPRSCVIEDEAGLTRLSGLASPLAMKGLSDRIAHKSEHGLVALELRSDEELRRAFTRVRAALAKADPGAGKILVEEMASGGLEAIVGMQRDPIVGPVIAVGAGGILVELLDDAVVLMPPFTAEELDAALAKTKFGRLLSGYRGRRYDRRALIEVAVTLGELALAAPCLRSVDINPLFVLESGVVAVDAKIMLDPAQ